MMTSNSSPSTWCYLSWLHTAMFLVLSTTLYTPILVSCSKIDTRNYNNHCASTVPESTPNDVPESTAIPFAAEQGGYFLGREDILNHPNSSRNHYPSSYRGELFIHTHNVYSTDADDVYKVEASLILKTSDMLFYMYDDTSPRGPLSFEVEGFWSRSTGKLCMVGSGSTSSEEGKHHVLPAVLKLDGVRDSSTISSLIGGTLESLSTAGDSGYFKPVSLLMIPQNHYEYTEVGKPLDHVCAGGIAVPKSSSLGLKLSTPICNAFSRWDTAYKLEYSSGCNSTSSCNPFGEGAGCSPQIMYLKVIQCLEDKRSLRFQIEIFPNSSYGDYFSPFTPNTTFVAEGSWDVNKNQLCVVGCRILNPANSLKKSHIEDCSVRLSFRFPAVWSIGHTSGTVGHIWSNKRENDPGYFSTIMFRSYENAGVGIPGSKYEYTVVDKARKSCTEKQPRKSKGKRHPDANSNDMKFEMEVRNSEGRRIGWGLSEPIAVGDQISRHNDFVISSSSGAAYSPVKGETNSSIPLNISYSMSFPLNESTHVEVFSEGIYDAETGKLCMVGCRYLDSNNRASDNDSMDCKILINVQFPPVDSNDYIRGTIESTGGVNDPLYFEPLSFFEVSYDWK